MTSDQIGDLWIKTLGASYEPDRDGFSYRGWLTSTLQILRSAESGEQRS